MSLNAIAAVVAMLMLAVAFAIGLFVGTEHTKAHLQAQRVEAVERAIAQAHEQAMEDAEIIAAAVERQAAIQDRTRIITRTVTRHVQQRTPATGGHVGDVGGHYRSCTLDAVGLCLAREAAAGRDGTACAGGTDDAVLAAGGASGREHGRLAGELRRDGDAAARMPGQARVAHGVGAP